MKRTSFGLFALALLGALACGGESQVAERSLNGLDLRRCKPAEGTSGAPESIEAAVALANGLPFPVTAACFVEALDRPLGMEATVSEESVQPAHGERSPRVFLWPSESLVIAIALDGPGKNLVEFGQFVTPRRSIKAEIEFPLTSPLSQTEPHDRVRNERHPEITSCFVCHSDEQDDPNVPRGRSSIALRPVPHSLVTVEFLSAERQRCDRSEEPYRCAYLDALFGHGTVEHRPFDPSLPLN